MVITYTQLWYLENCVSIICILYCGYLSTVGFYLHNEYINYYSDSEFTLFCCSNCAKRIIGKYESYVLILLELYLLTLSSVTVPTFGRLSNNTVVRKFSTYWSKKWSCQVLIAIQWSNQKNYCCGGSILLN